VPPGGRTTRADERPRPVEGPPVRRDDPQRGAALTVAGEQLAEELGILYVSAFNDPVLRGAEFWCEDRLHLNPYGHSRVAHLLLTALGVPSTPDPVPVPRPWHSGALAEARYYRDHVAPWVGRRIRKRSSGDNRSYKYADWTEIAAS
jgi:hypothetical protein